MNAPLAGRNRTPDVPAGQAGTGDRDLRGPYGFGRPAHGSDKRARYQFERAARSES